jgi:hypothetical protein
MFYFAVKNGATARLLRTAGGPDWPRVQQIEMTGKSLGRLEIKCRASDVRNRPTQRVPITDRVWLAFGEGACLTRFMLSNFLSHRVRANSCGRSYLMSPATERRHIYVA